MHVEESGHSSLLGMDSPKKASHCIKIHKPSNPPLDSVQKDIVQRILRCLRVQDLTKNPRFDIQSQDQSEMQRPRV